MLQLSRNQEKFTGRKVDIRAAQGTGEAASDCEPSASDNLAR
jgi:hypothetical protein